jgi:hypothetical protein
MFPYRNIHKYNWISAEGNTPGQTYHDLIERRRQSNILDVRSFRGADCDTNHDLVLAKVRERLAVSKRAALKIDTERCNVNKLNERGMLKNRIVLQSETNLQLCKT